MKCLKDTFTNTSIIRVVFFFSFILFIKPASALGVSKCNLMNDSVLTFTCTDAIISVKYMDYIATVNDSCSRSINCNKTLSGKEDGKNILCHGQYGDCTQPLDNTILDDACPNVKNLAVDTQYECIPFDADVPTDRVECPMSNDTLIPNLSCPGNSLIHIHSVGYWKVLENRLCLQSKDQCYLNKTGVEDLMYKKCRGENECRPTLPISINDGRGCDYQIPNIGADIKYSCLNNESMYDVCDSLEVELTNNTAVYLISREYINKPGVYEEPFCTCTATSGGMDVKLLYYDMPPDTTSGKRSQLILRDTDQTLNLKMAEIVDAEPFPEPKKNLTVEFIHNNINNQIFLIEFKALNGNLKLKCGNPTPITVPDSTSVSTNGLVTQTPIIVTIGTSTQNPNEGGLVQGTNSKFRLRDEDLLIIGIVIGLLVLLAFIILVIALIIRRRRQKYKADEEESVYSGLDNPAFLHQTYSVIGSDTKSQSSDFISDPQNQTSIPIHQDERESLREIDQSEHIENNGLNRIGPNGIGSNPESIPEAIESLDDYDPNYKEIDYLQEPVQSTSAPSVLAAPPVDHVEYAKVNKIKKSKVQNESLFDNSFSNITPPQIPDKTYTEEEISEYRQEKLKPFINIINVPEDDKAHHQNNNHQIVLNEGKDVIQSIPVQPDVVIFQPNSDSTKHDDEESVLSGNDLSTVQEEDEISDMTSSFPDVSSAVESPPRKLHHQSSYTEVPFLY